MEQHVIEAVLQATGVAEFQNAMNDAQQQVQDFGTDAGGALDKFGSKMTDIGQGFSVGVTAPLVGGLIAVTQGSEEMVAALARLDTNSLEAGFDPQASVDGLSQLSVVSDDVGANVEALSNLLASGLNAEQMDVALQALTGTAIKFSDTLSMEGVADGLQETLATGKAVGSFGELLERSGVNLETFDEKMASLGNEAERTQFAIDTLSKLELGSVTDEFAANNQELVESRESAIAFQLAMAELAVTLTPIITDFTNVVTDLMETFNELDPESQQFLIKAAMIAAAIGPVLIGVGQVVKGFGALKLMFTLLSGPVGLAVAAIALIGLGLYKLWTTNEEFRDGVKAIWDSITSIFTDTGATFDAVGDKFDAFVKGLPDSLSGYGELFAQAGTKIIDSIWEGMKAGFGKVTEGFGGFLGDLRDKLPFSPPRDKSSPMSGLNKNGITTEIAKGIYSGSGAVDSALGDVLTGARSEIDSMDGLAIDTQLDVTRNNTLNGPGTAATNDSPAGGAYINLNIGGQVFRAFVENISREQDARTAVDMAY